MVIDLPVRKSGFTLALGPEPRHAERSVVKLSVERLNFWYGAKHALKDIDLSLHEREVTALIGPSGCGKTTVLRCLNRTAELIPDVRMTGRICLDGADINDPHIDPPLLRRRFGWVAQRPNPFPWSIAENVAYGAHLHGLIPHRRARRELVESCLRRVGLWDEVKDRLREPGTDLSGGQQQRLCIARAIANRPDVILMDEPCSSLDPVATATIENLIDELRRDHTIVIVTHNMQQAARVAQRVAMFHLGRMLEAGDAERILLAPAHDVTEAYITGRFG
jgi:phosphate transport system ATP-binding protein